LKEPPSFPQCERYHLRPTPLVVQLSNPCWSAAPHRPQMPDQISRPELPHKVRSAKDDIVGWPDELAIDFLDYVLSWTTPRQTPPD
jgi:hypothetical protein